MAVVALEIETRQPLAGGILATLERYIQLDGTVHFASIRRHKLRRGRHRAEVA
jgi:hypothetical protein